MREIRTSGSMSGEGKRTALLQHRASPRLYCQLDCFATAAPMVRPHPMLTGTSGIVSLPNMSITFTATVQRPRR